MNDKLTLTIEQAGEVLGISRPSVYKLVRLGQMPGVIRLGRRLLVSKPALMRYLETAGQVADNSISQLAGCDVTASIKRNLRRYGVVWDNDNQCKVENKINDEGYDRLIKAILGQRSFNLRTLEEVISKLVDRELEKQFTKRFDEGSIIVKPKEIEVIGPRLSASIETLGLSVKAENCLRRGGMSLVGDLLDGHNQFAEDKVKSLRNAGIKTLNEIKQNLKKFLGIIHDESNIIKPVKVNSHPFVCPLCRFQFSHRHIERNHLIEAHSDLFVLGSRHVECEPHYYKGYNLNKSHDYTVIICRLCQKVSTGPAQALNHLRLNHLDVYKRLKYTHYQQR